MPQILEKNSPWARRAAAAVSRGALSHAVILSGSGDKEPYAGFLAAAMLCPQADKPCMTCRDCRKVAEGVHPDLIWVREEEKKELSADTVRGLRQDVYIRPNEAERKVYVFADAGQLNERDQNILLKIVEEGPDYAAFIFCADTARSLLPTVRSRCTEYHVPAGEGTVPEEAGELVDALCRKDAAAVASYLVGWENRRPGREKVQKVLHGAWMVCAEALLQEEGKPATAVMTAQTAKLRQRFSRRQIQKLTEILARYGAECNYNVGEGHVLGALAVEMEGVII